MGNPLRIADESYRKPILHHNVEYASMKRITCLYLCIFIPKCIVCLRETTGQVLRKGILVGLRNPVKSDGFVCRHTDYWRLSKSVAENSKSMSLI